MRKSLLAFSLLLLSFCWAAAQNQPNQNQQTQSPGQTQNQTTNQNSQSPSNASGETTVRGCLSSSNGNYMLTDKSGNTYQLSGDSSKFSDHVGHEVKITGTESNSNASQAGAIDQNQGSAQKTIQVTSLKHISKTCQNGNSAMSH